MSNSNNSMDRRFIYLDNSATTRQYDEVIDLETKIARECFGNPSSLHSFGFEAENLLFNSRKKIEDSFFGNGNVIFTSGGTESDNMALISSAIKMKRRASKVITTSIEHPAVIETCSRLADRGFQIEKLGVDRYGCVNINELEEMLTEDTAIVSIMTVNNEIGTIEPVIDVFKLINSYNKANGTDIIFHTDAVQAYGKLPLDVVPFDLVSVSAHKIHGPKGVGALYMDKRLRLRPLINGGGQEDGYRSGTENTAGISGFGLASEKIHTNMISNMQNISKVNDYLRKGLLSEIPDIQINGNEENGFSLYDAGKRCPSILNVSFYGTRGEVILHALERDGIFVSTGSACSSHKSTDSHVLTAIGLNHKTIEASIRFSLSEFNTVDEMDYVIAKTESAVKKFRKLGTFR